MKLFIEPHREGEKLWRLEFNDPNMILNPEEIRIAVQEVVGKDIISLEELIKCYRIVNGIKWVNKEINKQISGNNAT